MISQIPTESWRYHLRRGITDLWFILSVISALLLLFILLGYHNTDPAWNTTGDGPVRHWFGSIGAYTADILLSLFGYAAYFIPFGIAAIGWQSVRKANIEPELMIWKMIALVISVVVLAGMFSLHWAADINPLAVTAGGLTGQRVGIELLSMWPVQIIMLIYSVLFLLGITLLLELHWLRITERIGIFITDTYYKILYLLNMKSSRISVPKAPVAADNDTVQRRRQALRARLVSGTGTQKAESSLFSSSGAVNQEAEPPLFSSSVFPELPEEVASEPSLFGDSAFTSPTPDTGKTSSRWADYKAAQHTRENTVSEENNEKKPEDSSELMSVEYPQKFMNVVPPVSQTAYSPKSDYAMRKQAEGAPIRDCNYEDGSLVSSINEEDFSALEEDFPDTASPYTVAPAYANYADTTPQESEQPRMQVRIRSPQIIAPVINTTAHGEYRLPGLDLLNPGVTAVADYSDEELDEMAMQVENTLKDYKLNVRVENIAVGPVVTRIELSLAPGIKVSSISNLDKDIARSLAVQSVRVVEVIPGKSFIGLEIPNRKREVVPLRDMLESPAYQKETSPLTMVLGADISGKPVVANLGDMPHLLVAGTTGSGKSVGINVMLAGMLFKARPDELKLILVDPKILELSMYQDIPHLLTPVVTDMNNAENALRWTVAEMERRYHLLAAMRVRKLDEFNKLITEAQARGEAIADPLWNPDEHIGLANQPPNLKPLPYIVIIIDELADMMMVAPKSIEQLIARIAQKARAAGIHLILATQRPSVDVITGLIKANVPARVAFQVSSKIDSRTILDAPGAETLLGYGDMLYSSREELKRVHGAFIDDKEVDRLTTYLKQQAKPQYEESITAPVPASAMGALGATEKSDDPELDPLYDQAVQVIIDTGKASISGLQRHLGIGYNRAARMVDMMERAGLVSAPDNKGLRKVLVAGGGSDDI